MPITYCYIAENRALNPVETGQAGCKGTTCAAGKPPAQVVQVARTAQYSTLTSAVVGGASVLLRENMGAALVNGMPCFLVSPGARVSRL